MEGNVCGLLPSLSSLINGRCSVVMSLEVPRGGQAASHPPSAMEDESVLPEILFNVPTSIPEAPQEENKPF